MKEFRSRRCSTSPTSRHARLLLGDVRQEIRLLTAPLAEVVAGKAKWRPVADFADEVTNGDLNGDQLYLLTTQGHPRGRVLKVSVTVPDLPLKAIEVVPELKLVLQGMARAKDGLYLQAMEGGLVGCSGSATTKVRRYRPAL